MTGRRCGRGKRGSPIYKKRVTTISGEKNPTSKEEGHLIFLLRTDKETVRPVSEEST